MPKKTDVEVDVVADEIPAQTTVSYSDSINDILLELYAKANEPFEKTHQRSIAGGKMLTYITTEQSMSRLQDVYGPRWQWTVSQPTIHANGILVVGTLTVCVAEGVYITRDGAGGANIATRRDSGEPLDIGNNFKAAESSAFKRAAAKFGVGARYYEKTDDDYATPSQLPSQGVPTFIPPTQQVQFGSNNSTGTSTTGSVEAVSLPKIKPDGKPSLGGLKVNGQWYNVSNRAPFVPTLQMKGQVVTIQHPADGTFIDSVTWSGSPAPAQAPQEAF